MTLSYSTRSNIITLHDAITDSPLYRASTLHFDKQLDVFLQWINDLVQQTKRYAEKLKELNAETIALTTKLNPTSMVNYQLLDSKIIDMAANKFGDAMKTNLTFKMKTVSDLEGKFTGPIEKFVDVHIRAFKDFRKQHKYALMEYENALANYGALSNNSNDSTDSIHTTTQQLHSARKKYVEMSSEHITRIAKLRHDLEHTLMEQYSTAISSRKDFYNDAQVWKQLNTMLFSWADWIAEDKRTYLVEIQNQQLAQQSLEREYLDAMQLKHGVTTKTKMKLGDQSTKSGYLTTQCTKDGSTSWHRQWFFIHDGYFGSCKVTDHEASANVTVDNCVPLQLCQFKSLDSPDRRFCFELVSNQHSQKSLFILQAESETDLQDWTLALAPNTTTPNFDRFNGNRPSSILIDNKHDPNNDPSQARSPASLISKSKSTTVVSTPTDVPVTLSTNSDLSVKSASPGSTMFSHLSASPPVASASVESIGFKMTCSLDNDMRLSTAPSSTPLLLHEITNGLQQQHLDNISNIDSIHHMKTWGTLRTAIPLSQSSTRRMDHSHTEKYKSVHGKVVWPISQDSHLQSSGVSDLPDYTDHLKNNDLELRMLFNGVSPQEVVLDVWTASFLKKQNGMTTLEYQQGIKELKKLSTMGNLYWGTVYATQDTFWFYSCLSCSCITTVALKLKNIKDIHVAQDTELVIHMLDNGDNDASPSPLVFSVLEDVDSVIDKLRFLVYNAKLTEPMQLRNVYRKITTMSSAQSPLSSPAPSISTLDDRSDDSPHSSNDYGNNPQHASPTRMTSSNTTTTIDTSATLVTPARITKSPIKKNTVITKRFVDPDALPEHIIKPSGPLDCHCDDHLDRRDAEMELPISAKRLYELMFSDELTAPPTDGGVWNSKTKGIDGHDLRVSLWQPISDEQEGQMKRTLKYWMPVANPVVRMKEAEVVETQILLKKQDYLCYVVQISTKTEALPFADAFIPSVRYCITYVDDSRCKLTCHLGVRWTKWVMAKIIVTKAALAGMSDSVNIFVPILKEAANATQLTVETIRQAEQESAKQVISEYESDDNNDEGVVEADDNSIHEEKSLDESPAMSTPNIDIRVASTTIPIEEQREMKGDHNNIASRPMHPSTSPNNNQVPNTGTTPARTDLPRTVTIATTTATSTTFSQSKMKTGTTNTHHRLVKEKLTDASGEEAPSLVKAALDSIWPPGVWTLGTLVIGCLLYIVWMSTSVSSAMDHQDPIVHAPQVLSHAVYLRDLDNGFINKSLRPPYVESQCYSLFLQTRKDEHEYTWYAAQHYRLALEYRSSREQLGIQRHNIITTFQALNSADTELLEIEYLNWLLDNRQRCRGEQQQRQLALEFNDTTSTMCDQINTQIGTYF